jgi:ABC-type amino acid transport substrate-binding protein
VLSKSDEIANIQDHTRLDIAERTYAALEGSTNAKFVRERLPKAKLVTTPDYETAVQLVIDGEADALFADFQVCNLAQWRHPEAALHTMMTPFTTEPLGIALPADDPLLLNLVSNYLNTLENTGQLAQLKAKWLADGDWLSEVP